MERNKLAPTYEELKEKSPLSAEIIPEKIWDGIHMINKRTADGLGGLWNENLEANLKSSWFEQHMRANELQGLGTNKAVIGVGAGPSFKKNEDVLKALSDINVSQPLDGHPFLIVASNHMYKPLLEKEIYPHFVMLIDGGDAVYDQLCKDVPKQDKTILLAPLQINPRIAEEWSKQGRPIVWCNSLDEDKMEIYKKHTGDDPMKVGLEFGGNVLNCIWAASLKFLRSFCFMAVGNDLCFPRVKSLTERRKGYYATGDYEINIKNMRDEARSEFAWMGFNLNYSEIMMRPYVDFEPVNLSHTLFTYKTWCESQVIINSEKPPVHWHYFNCSEAGSLGVMSRSDTKEEMAKEDNWYLLDHHDIVGRHYHTARLEDAAWRWIKWREQKARNALTGILTDVKSAGILHHPTSTVADAGRILKQIKTIH